MYRSIVAVLVFGMVLARHSAAAFSRACRSCSFISLNYRAAAPGRSAVAVAFQSTREVSSTHPLFSHDANQAANAETKKDEDDSLNHRKYYRISGTGQRSKVTMKTNTGHTIQTDVPLKMGGTDSAPQPVETLLAALLGCTQATAIYVGRMMQPRLLIDKIEFENFEAYRDERGALERPIDVVPSIGARLQCVSGTVRVYFKKGRGGDITDDQMRILSEQTEARCPVANMMHASGCEMDIKWVNGNGS